MINKRLFAFLLPGLLSFGCATEDEGDRDRLGFRAASGSCTPDDCGGQASDGTCYCDSACATYGDCCENYEATCDGDDPLPPPEPTGTLCLSDEACEAGEYCDHSVCYSNCPEGAICILGCFGECLPTPPPLDSCEGSCGGQAPDGCWCDEACEGYGDCCEDKVQVCDPCTAAECGPAPGAPNYLCPDGETVAGPSECMRLDDGSCGYEIVECPVTVCGGFGNIPCPEGQICVDDPTDDCDIANGGADCGGMCIPDPGPDFCGGFAGIPCPEGQTCVDDPSDDCDPANGGADCGGICVDEPAPEPDPDSCEGHCDGQAPGGCWCDDACTGYGDCCGDYEPVCTGTACGEEVCGAGETCVTNYTQLGPERSCEAIGAGCGGTATCECMGAEVCTGAFDSCSADESTGGLACYCPAC